MKTRSKKGFTLAELLIVIAIIAVLIAIMFPVFGSQLDKARAAEELANVRAAYSEAVADAMLGTGTDLTSTVSVVTVPEAPIKAALRYSETKVTVKDGKPSSKANGSVKVEYKTYTGEFATDPDVKFGFTTTHKG